MEIQTVSQASCGAPDLRLGDLFVPQSGPQASQGRQAGSLTLDARFAQRQVESLAATGQLPDTLFAGAWLLLQSRWLGPLWPALHEARRATVTVAFDATETAGAWLAELDTSRRAAPWAAETSRTEAPASLWLRDDVGPAEADAPVRLWLSGTIAPDAPLRLHMDAAASLMDAASLEQLLAALADTASDLLDRPDAVLNDIRTLPASDLDAQLTAWNTAPAPVDRALTVTGMFSRQVAASRDAIALAHGEAAMTYGELDRQSSDLAHALQDAGVRSGDNVGLLLDRSMPAVVAQLGILKAGAAYVPVPVDFPAERIAYMLDEAAAHHVITTQAHTTSCPPHKPFFCSTMPSATQIAVLGMRPPSTPNRSPTSCTPRARPACPRASRSATAPSCGWSSASTTSRSRRASACCMRRRSPSMRPRSKSGARCSMAAAA
jgi:hypothetical protein